MDGYTFLAPTAILMKVFCLIYVSNYSNSHNKSVFISSMLETTTILIKVVWLDPCWQLQHFS